MSDRSSPRPRAARAPRLRTWLAAAVLLPLLPLVGLVLVQALDRGEGNLAQALAWPAAVALACAVLGLLLARQLERRVAAPLQQLAQGRPVPEGTPSVREVQDLQALLEDSREREAIARERLETRAAQWQALVDDCPVALAWTYDRHARRIGQNPAMQALLGEDAQAAAPRLLRNGRELAPQEWPLQHAAATGEPVGGWTLELLRPGHPRRVVLAQALPLRTAAGEPRGALLSLVDLSAPWQSLARRNAADERLRALHRQVQQAQEATGAGVFHHDFGDDRLQWTPALCRLFGIGARQPEGPLAGWFGHIDETDRARVEREFWTACALRRPRLVLDYRVRLGDGRQRRLSSRLAIRYDAEGHALEMSGLTLDLDGFEEGPSPVVMQAATEPAPHEEPCAEPTAGERQLLLVLGDAQAATALQAPLAQAGHRVRTVADPAEALRQLLELQPEVSMVEVGAAGLDALALARQARAAGYAGRLVALCRALPSDEARQALAAGFDACLALPLDRLGLRACLDGGALA